MSLGSRTSWTLLAAIATLSAGTPGPAHSQAATAPAPPFCAQYSVPFPCGQGTYQVCTKTIKCRNANGKATSQCIEAKCVAKSGPTSLCNTGNKAADAKCLQQHSVKNPPSSGAR